MDHDRRLLAFELAMAYNCSVEQAQVVVEEIYTAPGGSETVRSFLNRPPA